MHDKGYYHAYLEEALVTPTPDDPPALVLPPQNTRQGDGLALHRATWRSGRRFRRRGILIRRRAWDGEQLVQVLG